MSVIREPTLKVAASVNDTILHCVQTVDQRVFTWLTLSLLKVQLPQVQDVEHILSELFAWLNLPWKLKSQLWHVTVCIYLMGGGEEGGICLSKLHSWPLMLRIYGIVKHKRHFSVYMMKYKSCPAPPWGFLYQVKYLTILLWRLLDHPHAICRYPPKTLSEVIHLGGFLSKDGRIIYNLRIC